MLAKADIARLRSLREKKHRDALSLHVVEGEKVIAELLASGYPLSEIYATPAWQAPSASAILQSPVIRVTPAEMERISHYPTPSSVLAVGSIVRRTLASGEIDRGLTLALDGIQDAGNFGTLLRVADWFGFDRVVASPDCVDVYNQKVVNASMGSFSRTQVFVTNLPELFASTPACILGCDLSGEDIHSVAPCRDAIVAIGSEGRGLSEGVRKRVKRFVTIPRFGSAESLNAAVAAAIVCDNLRRAGVGQTGGGKQLS